MGAFARAGTLAARLEERAEEVFGFSEDTLQAAGQGFILGKRASSVKRSTAKAAKAKARASIDAEGEWGFVDPNKHAAKAGGGGKKSTPTDFYVKKGGKGYGFALRDEDDGVYINRLKAGSSSLKTLGKAMVNAKVLKVNGKRVGSKAEMLKILKEREDGTDIQLLPGVRPVP